MERIHGERLGRFCAMLMAIIILMFCFSPVALAANSENVKLTAWSRTDSLRFDFQNMLPGDSESKEYTITVTDNIAKAITMKVDLADPTAKLGEVLNIKVESEGNLLYEGLMRDMGSLTKSITVKNSTNITYRVTVSLDESVTNDYMGLTLSADFKWTLEREDTPPITPIETTSRDVTTAETTMGTTTKETTSKETTTETTLKETTAETTTETTTETTPVETTSETAFIETTTEYVPIETTTETTPGGEIVTTYCCKCCIGYKFPYSCNFGDFGKDDIGCDLPWCCASGNGCWCPWCWIIPLVIIIVLLIVIILVIRKLAKKEKTEDEDEEPKSEETAQGGVAQ